MNKGKLKESVNRHLSIVFIPHSSNQVKVFKFTSFYGKILSALLILIALLISAVIYLTQVTWENNALKKNLSDLYSANSQQRKLIDEKNDEILQLEGSDKAFKKAITEKTDEFTKKFNEITDTYIDGQDGSKTSRAGERTSMGFSGEIGSLKNILDSLNKLSARADAMPIDLSEANEKLEKYFESIPTLWPAEGEISDGFGYRKDPFTRRKTFHEGLDISADSGVPIKAAAGGKVISAKRVSGYGLTVVIDHGRGLSTLYGHASKLLVEAGQTVKKGDVIAKVGSTGRSTGPHLHFEIWLYNTPVDPLQYLDVK